MIPLTLSEAKAVARTHAMDPYHRDVLRFLIAEVERFTRSTNAVDPHAQPSGTPSPRDD